MLYHIGLVLHRAYYRLQGDAGLGAAVGAPVGASVGGAVGVDAELGELSVGALVVLGLSLHVPSVQQYLPMSHSLVVAVLSHLQAAVSAFESCCAQFVVLVSVPALAVGADVGPVVDGGLGVVAELGELVVLSEPGVVSELAEGLAGLALSLHVPSSQQNLPAPHSFVVAVAEHLQSVLMASSSSGVQAVVLPVASPLAPAPPFFAASLQLLS